MNRGNASVLIFARPTREKVTEIDKIVPKYLATLYQ